MKVLHEKAIQVAREFRRAESALIEVIQEVENAKVFQEYQCRNLHEYCTKFMKLSDDVAATFIRNARKAREVPALKQKLVEQSVSISNARLIARSAYASEPGIVASESGDADQSQTRARACAGIP